MVDLLHTFVTGAWSLLSKVFLIVVPIMVVLELFEGTRPFRALVRTWSRLVGRWLGMSEQVAAPTLIGFIFGLAYGGGVIVRDARRHGVERRQVFQMSVFLSMIHAIFEDTTVFVVLASAAGANVIWTLAWLVGFRLIWAFAVTLLLGAAASWWLGRRERPAGGPRRDRDD